MSIPIPPFHRARSVPVEVCVVRTDLRVCAARVTSETRARTAALRMMKEIRVAIAGPVSTRARAWLPAPAIRVGAAKLVS